MGTQWSQDEEFQSSDCTGTTPQVKPQSHNQNKEEKSVVTQSTKAAATAKEPNLAHKNDEQQLKKTTMYQSSDTSSKVTATKTEIKLPHNYETIVKYLDTPIDRSSVEKMHEQLQAGVFLDQKRKRY